MAPADAQMLQDAELEQIDAEILQLQWVEEESKRTRWAELEFDAIWNAELSDAAASLNFLDDPQYKLSFDNTRIEARHAWRDGDKDLARGLMQSVLQDLDDKAFQKAIKLSQAEYTTEWLEGKHEDHSRWSRARSTFVTPDHLSRRHVFLE